MNIANWLTFSRIILVPVFIFFLFSGVEYNLIIAGVIFSISGLTDLLDGYIARKYDQVTKLGRLLDPLADKLTMISVFIALAIKNIIPLSFIAIILVREFIVLLGSIFVYFNLDGEEIIAPSIFGKLATFLLYVAAASYILDLALLKLVIFIALPFTVISGFNYCLKAYYFFAKENKNC